MHCRLIIRVVRFVGFNSVMFVCFCVLTFVFHTMFASTSLAMYNIPFINKYSFNVCMAYFDYAVDR